MLTLTWDKENSTLAAGSVVAARRWRWEKTLEQLTALILIL
jgi:hypothetical protein